MFRKLLDYAEAGDNIGALLRGVQRNEIERGQVLSKPGTIHPHTKFKGEVYVLTKDEGGRPIAIEKGLRFAIREGGRTVGSGVVSEIEEA